MGGMERGKVIASVPESGGLEPQACMISGDRESMPSSGPGLGGLATTQTLKVSLEKNSPADIQLRALCSEGGRGAGGVEVTTTCPFARLGSSNGV